MKIVTAWAMAMVSCGMVYGQKSGHEIAFQIAKAKVNTKVSLAHFYGQELRCLDSAKLNSESKVIFKGTAALPQGLYLLQFGSYSLDFVVGEEQKFTITASLPYLDYSAKIKGSKDNSLYFQYKQMLFRQRAKIEKRRTAPETGEGGARTVQEAIKESSHFIDHYRDSIFQKYYNALAVKIIQAGIDKVASARKDKLDSREKRALVFQHIDLDDARLIHTPYIEEKMLQYIGLTPFNPDSLAKGCDEVLDKMEANPEVYKFALTKLRDYFEKSNRPWMDVLYTYLVKKFYLQGKATWADSTEIRTMQANVKRLEPLLTGVYAQPIDFYDTLGNIVPLYSVKAKYTILYFWDADCEHCQKVTPKLWELYQKVQNEDIEVYAVSTQQTSVSWKEYLRTHPFSWINVWNPMEIAETFKTYQIGTTPGIYLLDKDKRILCKRISLEELEKYLSMLLQTPQ